MINLLSLFGGIGVGAAAMYVLDPEAGTRRRALARDKMIGTANRMCSVADATVRDLTHRSAGMVSEVRSRFSAMEVDDEVLEGRVRSKLGYLVRQPSAVTTHVSDHHVILSGSVLSDEIQQLIDGVRAVRGVASVENNLAVHDDAADMPGLLTEQPKPSGQVWDIMQRRWSPSTRFLVSTAGAVSLGLIAYSFSDAPRQTLAATAQRLGAN